MKLAQYGQWDGYPSGQGSEIVAFLQAADLEVFAAKVRKSRMVTDAELKALWAAAGADPDSDMVNMEVSGKFKKVNPQLSRGSGAGTLAYILKAEEPLVQGDSTPFAGDSLFCEWAYVIDLDAGVFEAHQGCQKEPHTEGRFASLPYDPPEYKKGQPQEYFPVKLVGSFPLDDIPPNWISIVEGSPLDALAAADRVCGIVR